MAKLTLQEALHWIDTEPHHNGWAYGPHDNPEGMGLSGLTKRILIPSGLIPENYIRPSNFSKTGRLFELTDAGRAALAEHQP